jgi:four helix bundle protein
VAAAQKHQDLLVWQKSMDLCDECYRFAARLPKDELYDLVSQLRRASVSIPSNIAEGFGREHKGSFAQHLRSAQGSLRELETQVVICRRVGLATDDQCHHMLSQADELGRMLRAFIRSLGVD